MGAGGSGLFQSAALGSDSRGGCTLSGLGAR